MATKSEKELAPSQPSVCRKATRESGRITGALPPNNTYRVDRDEKRIEQERSPQQSLPCVRYPAEESLALVFATGEGWPMTVNE